LGTLKTTLHNGSSSYLTPSTGSAYLLDPAARTSSRISRAMAVADRRRSQLRGEPLSMTRFIGFYQPQAHSALGNAVTNEESVGRAAVAGIQAVGTPSTGRPTELPGRN
jgi:hypothetical protein